MTQQLEIDLFAPPGPGPASAVDEPAPEPDDGPLSAEFLAWVDEDSRRIAAKYSTAPPPERTAGGGQTGIGAAWLRTVGYWSDGTRVTWTAPWDCGEDTKAGDVLDAVRCLWCGQIEVNEVLLRINHGIDRPGSPLRTRFLSGRMRFLRPGQDVIGPNERPPFGVLLAIWQRDVPAIDCTPTAPCPVCRQLHVLTREGRLWAHGPRTARCRGSRLRLPAARAAARTIRGTTQPATALGDPS